MGVFVNNVVIIAWTNCLKPDCLPSLWIPTINTSWVHWYDTRSI